MSITGESRHEYSDLVLASEPVGYWPLRQDARDESGNGHHGRHVGSLEYIQDLTGGWVKLDGKSYIEVHSDPSFSQPPSNSGLTVEVWVRLHEVNFEKPKYIHWLGKGEPRKFEWAFRLYPSSGSKRSSRLSAYLWNPGGKLGAGAYAQDAITQDEWIYLVACFQPGDAENEQAGVLIYKNGKYRQGPAESPATRYHHPPKWRIFPKAGNAPVRFGTRNDFANCLKGGLAEIAIYTTVLDQAVIDRHYQLGKDIFK